jgi:hypothetical protein
MSVLLLLLLLRSLSRLPHTRDTHTNKSIVDCANCLVLATVERSASNKYGRIHSAKHAKPKNAARR